jgi:Fe-S-cluster containining protein
VSRERIDAAGAAAFERTSSALAAGLDATASAALCAETNAALEAEFARFAADGAPVACRAGCAFCCHQRVGVFPHEALSLWYALRAELSAPLAAEIERRVRANAARVEAVTEQEHRAANLPCAFLVDGRCSAYAHRPSVCASFHSMSRARCEHAFGRPEEMGTPRNSRPVLLDLKAVADAVSEATANALRAAGLDSRKLELSQAVRALLDDAEAAQRWRAGGALCAAG